METFIQEVSMHSMAAPKIERYDEIPAFLRDHFRYKKMRRSGWSYHVWARALGLNSGSLLSKVLRGERRLSDDLLVRLVVSFEANESETECWLRLHLASRAEELRALIRDRVREKRAEETSN